jgi:hypothetical protein
MVLAGYFLGGVIERALGIKLEDHIEKVVIAVVFLSLLPPIIEYLRHRRAASGAVKETEAKV